MPTFSPQDAQAIGAIRIAPGCWELRPNWRMLRSWDLAARLARPAFGSARTSARFCGECAERVLGGPLSQICTGELVRRPGTGRATGLPRHPASTRRIFKPEGMCPDVTLAAHPGGGLVPPFIANGRASRGPNERGSRRRRCDPSRSRPAGEPPAPVAVLEAARLALGRRRRIGFITDALGIGAIAPGNRRPLPRRNNGVTVRPRRGRRPRPVRRPAFPVLASLGRRFEPGDRSGPRL